MILNPSLKNSTNQEKTFGLKLMLEEEIEQVESPMYVGIKLNGTLSWKSHAKQLSKKVISSMLRD